MYSELWDFFTKVGRQRSHLQDGELWTALALGAASYFVFHEFPSLMDRIARHFGDLLTVVSIVFGFVLTALGFYAQAAQTWKRDPKVSKVADMIVDWHVWTLIWLLFLLGFLIVVWTIQGHIERTHWPRVSLFSGIVLLSSYTGFQILNHILTVWWVFRNRGRLSDPPQPKGPTEPGQSNDP